MVALGAQSCSAASALSRVILFPFVAVHGGLLGLLAAVQTSLYPLWGSLVSAPSVFMGRGSDCVGCLFPVPMTARCPALLNRATVALPASPFVVSFWGLPPSKFQVSAAKKLLLSTAVVVSFYQPLVQTLLF